MTSPLISTSTSSTACVRVRQASQQDRKQIIPLSGDALREELHDPEILN